MDMYDDVRQTWSKQFIYIFNNIVSTVNSTVKVFEIFVVGGICVFCNVECVFNIPFGRRVK